MATIKELKEWLNQFPDDTEVLFAKQQSPPAWESYGCVEFVEPDLTLLTENYGYGDNWELTDFTGNQFVKEESPDFNKKYLRIGSKD